MASKASYASAVSAGAAAGMVAGTFVAGPVGAIAGGIAGGVGGGYLIERSREKKVARTEEKRWQSSAAGLKAIEKRDKEMQAITSAYEEKRGKLTGQATTVKAEYEAARDAGVARLAENRAGGLKGVAALPEVRAGVKSAGQAALNVAGTILNDELHRERQRRNPNPYPRTKAPQETALAAAGGIVRQAKGFKERVQQEREQAWKSTPEGKETAEKYKQAARQLEARKREVVNDYKLKKKDIEEKYNLSRDSFLRAHRAEA